MNKVFFINLVFTHLLYVVQSSSPAVTKNFRSDYVYNRKTDAFYKFHIEGRSGRHVKNHCELEGARLMVPTPQDVAQAHSMFKQYPDLGKYAYVDSDGGKHESAEEQPLINLNQETYDENSDNQEIDNFQTAEGGCDVITRTGDIEMSMCYHLLPFICKVDAKDAPYDSHCDVFATGYKYYHEVGSCYKIPEQTLTWEEAYAECRAEGAHLAVINSQAEDLVIKNISLSSTPALTSQHSWYFLIGFRAIKPSRDFRTIFNQTLEEAGFSEWSYTEPNNLFDSEYCGSILKSDGKLNDVNCVHSYAFICEKEVRL